MVGDRLPGVNGQLGAALPRTPLRAAEIRRRSTTRPRPRAAIHLRLRYTGFVTKYKGGELEAETRSQPSGGVSAAAALVPGLTVLWHPDPERVGERALLTALTSGREERLSRAE